MLGQNTITYWVLLKNTKMYMSLNAVEWLVLNLVRVIFCKIVMIIASSLSRIDQSRMSEATPRNMNDLQHIVNEQQERLTAVADQLGNLGQIVETIRREQREQADDVAGQLREFNRQLSALKVSLLCID